VWSGGGDCVYVCGCVCMLVCVCTREGVSDTLLSGWPFTRVARRIGGQLDQRHSLTTIETIASHINTHNDTTSHHRGKRRLLERWRRGVESAANIPTVGGVCEVVVDCVCGYVFMCVCWGVGGDVAAERV
jgi:hypothetical protein